MFSISWARNIFLMFLFALSVYLGYHSFYGSRGYYVLSLRRKQLEDLSDEFHNADLAHRQLVNKIKFMGDQVDPDLLEQQAWILLRHIAPSKKVIFYGSH